MHGIAQNLQDFGIRKILPMKKQLDRNNTLGYQKVFFLNKIVPILMDQISHIGDQMNI